MGASIYLGKVLSAGTKGCNIIVPTVASIDPDAQAFLTAAGITDATQQAAINTLVVDLKGYNIWSKMKAIYPFCGSTASQHKWNLKDPRDLDAAFRLVFNGGWTHSANGALPNGTNAYADTKLTPSTNLISGNVHASIYNRTNTVGNKADLSCSSAPDVEMSILSRFTGDVAYPIIGGFQFPTYSNNDSRGFWAINRQNTSNIQYYNRNTKVVDTVQTNGMPTNSIYIGAANVFSGTTRYSDRQIAFSSIGEGFNATEAANFYTAVQAFQTTLGRSIGTQTVSDADAQAFVTAANIVDQVEANAINNLVIGMKADGLWTKMKAVYPFVGGTATTHKFNLKNPLDTDAAFRIFWSGGVTHSTNGVQFGGVNGSGDSFVNVGTNLALNSTHVSVYSRTNVDRLAPSISNVIGSVPDEVSMFLKTGNICVLRVNSSQTMQPTNLDSRGFFIGNRANATQITLSIRGTQTTTANNSISVSTTSLKLGGISPYFDNKEIAFSSIGDGLTPTELTNLNTRVTTFQTALNRNV